jgi:hypothetical protein
VATELSVLLCSLLCVCCVFVYHIYANIIQEFVSNLSSRKWADCCIIAYIVKHVLFRYCSENLNPSGCLFYMQGRLIFWYVQYLYAVSGANNSEREDNNWMGTDFCMF